MSGADHDKKEAIKNLAEWIRELVIASPAYRYLNMEALTAADGASCIELTILEEQKNLFGIVHGGILAALLDAACGVALATLLKPGETLVTLDLRINYLAPVTTGTLTASATCGTSANVPACEARLSVRNMPRWPPAS